MRWARTTGVVPGLVAGAVGCVVIGVTFYFVHGTETGAKGLAMAVPVVGAALLGGRRAAYPIAIASTFAYSLLIPPIGTPRIHHFGDLVALIVFVVVAAVIVELVARRVDVLDHVDEQRSAMLRSVSHDLRTPLSAIKAATTELLGDHRHDAATERRLLQLVNAESDRLDRLVANLLDMSRIEAGVLRPQRQLVDAGELVAECSTRLASVLQTVRLDVDLDGDVQLSADHVLLDQLVTNLVDNAARHSPPDGTVSLRVAGLPDRVVITVVDQGPGVPDASRDDIFKPFASSRPGGGGVGLAICKAIVDAHAGSITVRDATEGGAEFVVSLPRR